MHMYNFLCSDSLLYTSFFFFLLYMVFIHVIVHGIRRICVVAVLLLPFTFLCVFVNCFVACIAVVSRGVMIGMSGESWRHKSTLSNIPSSILGVPVILPSIMFYVKTFFYICI